MSYRLWRQVAAPPWRGPLFQRSAEARVESTWWHVWTRSIGPLLPISYLVLAVLVCCMSISRMLGVFVVGAIVVLILFNGTLLGLRWSLMIAAELAYYRERRMWDVLLLAPEGGLGAAWAVATGCLYRDNRFTRRYGWHKTVLRAFLVILVIVAAGSLLDARSVYNGDTLVLFAYLASAALVSYADFVQSIVLGVLTGIWAGTQTQARFDAQALALGGFLLLQLAAYAGIALLVLAVLPAALRLIPATDAGQEAMLLPLRLLAIVGTREIILQALWRAVSGPLNSDIAVSFQ